MYISPSDHGQVFKEISRVLIPGGRLLIWDVVFPKKSESQQLYVIYPLHIRLPEKEINTGYGVKLVKGGLGLAHYLGLAAGTGFEVISYKQDKGWFFLELKKAG